MSFRKMLNLLRIYTESLKSKKLNLKLNGENIKTEKQFLANLLEELNLPKSGIAVAINDEVVPKTNWTEIDLKENDNILIITATQGG